MMIENGVIFFAKASQAVHGFAGLGYAGLRRARRESRPRFGGLMSFCGVSELDCSSLTRLLQTTGLSLALMTASAAGVYADTVTVQGVNSASGSDNFDPGGYAGSGIDGGPATANAGSLNPITDPLNEAAAIGGSGGNGGNNYADDGVAGSGGGGGAATATAATTIISGSASANAVSIGGNGGGGGSDYDPTQANDYSSGGSGGTATASATGRGSGNATVSASATGGNGDYGIVNGGIGGDANASSKASTTGSGDAVSSANATGGAAGGDFDLHTNIVGNATAMADASAAGGGAATAKAVATVGKPFLPFQTSGSATSTSNAETANGAMAQALSTATSAYEGQATSTARTSFGGVSVQSKATIPFAPDFGVTATTEAVAQGGSGQTLVDPSADIAAIATALPNRAYATTLIGGASNVADALLGPGPRDEIFGAAILQGAEFTGTTPSSTFDFSFQGDLILGVIADGGFDIIANGIDIPFEVRGDNSVINLGFLRPNIDLTIEGDGVFAFGGAVLEPSTWAMMLLGFAGLGFAGYRRATLAA